DAQALPAPRRFNCARTRQYFLRSAHSAAESRAHPGQAGRAVPALLVVRLEIVDRRRSVTRLRGWLRAPAMRRPRPRPFMATWTSLPHLDSLFFKARSGSAVFT